MSQHGPPDFECDYCGQPFWNPNGAQKKASHMRTCPQRSADPSTPPESPDSAADTSPPASPLPPESQPTPEPARSNAPSEGTVAAEDPMGSMAEFAEREAPSARSEPTSTDAALSNYSDLANRAGLSSLPTGYVIYTFAFALGNFLGHDWAWLNVIAIFLIAIYLGGDALRQYTSEKQNAIKAIEPHRIKFAIGIILGYANIQLAHYMTDHGVDPVEVIDQIIRIFGF